MLSTAKHTALGASSPLGSLKWTEIGFALGDAKTHDDAAADLAKQAEREYRARDLLLVANRDNPKALGDFGYVDDDSPQAKAKPKPAP